MLGYVCVCARGRTRVCVGVCVRVCVWWGRRNWVGRGEEGCLLKLQYEIWILKTNSNTPLFDLVALM